MLAGITVSIGSVTDLLTALLATGFTAVLARIIYDQWRANLSTAGSAQLINEDLLRCQVAMLRMLSSDRQDWKAYWFLDWLAKPEAVSEVVARLDRESMHALARAIGWAHFMAAEVGDAALSDIGRDELKARVAILELGREALASKRWLPRRKFVRSTLGVPPELVGKGLVLERVESSELKRMRRSVDRGDRIEVTLATRMFARSKI